MAGSIFIYQFSCVFWGGVNLGVKITNLLLSTLFLLDKNRRKYYGGEEGIRTLDAGLPHTPLAGERLRPLGHLSTAVDRQGELGFQVILLGLYDFSGNHLRTLTSVISSAPKRHSILEFFLKRAKVKLLCPGRAVLFMHHEKCISNGVNLKCAVFALAVEIFSP